MKQCIKCQEEKEEGEFYSCQKKCKKCQSEYAKQYRDNNKDKISLWQKNSYVKHKIKRNKSNRTRWKEKQLEYASTKKRYRINNREKINAYRRKFQKLRLKTDIDFKLRKNLRNRIHGLMKYGIKKSAHTMELLGCPIEQFKLHIERQFQSGMNWNNYGEWHIDHIRPCASFDLSNPDEQKACFHYTNLQPLWKEDNQRKSDKYVII